MHNELDRILIHNRIQQSGRRGLVETVLEQDGMKPTQHCDPSSLQGIYETASSRPDLLDVKCLCLSRGVPCIEAQNYAHEKCHEWLGYRAKWVLRDAHVTR